MPAEYGAKIAIGDWNETEGAKIVAELKEYFSLTPEIAPS